MRDAHYLSGGDFRVEQLEGELGDFLSVNDPIIRSLGDVSFFAYQGASLHILAGGQVDINTAVITGSDSSGNAKTFETKCRIDAPVEIQYYRDGGILCTVLKNLAA